MNYRNWCQMVLYLLLGAGLTLTNGWVAAARAIPGSAEPAVDALDIAASAVLLLMICWNVPKFTQQFSAVLQHYRR